MDYKKTVCIKEEVTDELRAEPNSMYLEDPLKTEKPSLRLKQEQEPELKWHVDGSERNVQVYSSTVNVKEELEEGVNQERHKTVTMDYKKTVCIKEEVTDELHAEPDSMYKTDVQRAEQISKQQAAQAEATAKQSSIIRDLEEKLDKMTEMWKASKRETEAAVVRYAVSEKELVEQCKEREAADHRLKDAVKEREVLSAKLCTAAAEKTRICQMSDSKCHELTSMQKEIERLKDDVNSRDIKIKWLQNKLRSETDTHKETQAKVDKLTRSLAEAKEECERVRKDCQEMIQAYQHSEENRAVVLDQQLKEEQAKLILEQYEREDKEEVSKHLQQELETVKAKHETIIAENNTLSIKVQNYDSIVNVKEELEECVNEEVLEDPISSTDFIKKDPELNLEADETQNIVLEDPISSTDFIKKNPELNLEADETQNIVVASTGYASKTTRIIKSIGENHGISFEKSVNQGVVHEELEENTEESTNVSMCGTHTQEFTSVDCVFGTSLKCSLSGKEFRNFTCSVCLQSFPSKYRLIVHVFTHIDNVEPPIYVCKLCGEVFPSDVSLHKHVKLSDSDQAVSLGINERFDSSDEHNFFRDDQEVSLSEQIKKQSSSKQTKMSKKPCSDVYNTHTRTSNAEKQDKQCNCRTLSTTGNINAHAVQFTARRLHNCAACGKCFTQLRDLKHHSLIHTGPRTHKCNTCGKSFIGKGVLKKHESIHTRTRPYICDTCGKSFTQLSNLKSHVLTHTVQTPHKCDICGKTFALLKTLRMHTLIHTGKRPHKCNTCGKSFIRSYGLKVHEWRHTGKKPHKCHICGKSFTQSGDLKKHGRIHTGERPHRCHICGKSFSTVSNLGRHAKTHTKKKPHNGGM